MSDTATIIPRVVSMLDTAAALAPRVVSMLDAAAALDVHRSTLYELVNAGEIRTIKVGGRRLVPVSEIDGYVERKLAETQLR